MINEYKEELEKLKQKMEKAEIFALKVPLFSGQILTQKYTGEETHINFGDRYKALQLNWGIKRDYLKGGTSRNITNFNGEYDGYFFNVYINTVSLFGIHNEFGLFDAIKGVDVFFTDSLNNTFYVTDENIESLLDALATWYEKAKVEAAKLKAAEQLAEAEERVAKLQADLDQ